MARVETIEGVGEAGIGSNGLFSQHNTCFMELTRPLQSWPGLLGAPTVALASGPARLRCGPQPPQPGCGQHPPSSLHPEGPGQPQSPTPSSAPHPLPDRIQGEEREGEFPGELSGLGQEQEPCHRQGPLPDLLPQTEHLSRLSSHHRGPNDSTVQLRVRRVALQLRTIGDEFNATLLHRANVPYWQDWRDACRVLLNFITQTLSTLYRLT